MPTDPVYLHDFSCFHNLTDEQVNSIAEITNAVCYPAGYDLFTEGQPGERMFFLVNGNVEVFYSIGEEGPARVDTVNREEIIGCAALVEPYTYTATERTLTEVEVLEIDAVALRRMMESDCQMGYLIQQNIIRVLMDRVLDLRLGSV